MNPTNEQANPSHDSMSRTTICEITNNVSTPTSMDSMDKKSPESHPTFDMEHAPVKNDPRSWSRLRKNLCLAQIASASMIAGLAANIQNPAVEEMERDLPATSSEFSLSISLFILLQGLVPLLWSSISEIKGRKFVYLISLGLFTVGSVVVAVSKNIGLVIGFRCMQAIGSSAVMAIGAATLADIFEPAERGTKMGIYYIAPLLGPALGPIFGGVLTTGLGWRSIFWFLTILSGTIFACFVIFFKDTFRKERSMTYQNVLKTRVRSRAMKSPQPSRPETPNKELEDSHVDSDVEKEGGIQDVQQEISDIKISLKDINPIKPIGVILRRKNNFVILFASGFLFAYGFLLAYTTARTLSSKYGYSPLKIGLVTLSYGIGCVAGSLLGGRWSDRELARLKAANGGESYPEMRLRSTKLTIFLLPLFVVGFGWVCVERVHVSAVCVFLFFGGFFSIWTYASTLAYIIDANNGRSSTAAALNSAFRGFFAFVATEIAVPLQDGLGEGWMYTIWAVLMLSSGLLIILVASKGRKWRETAEKREAEQAKKFATQ
ncbi:vacuolar DHA amino acid exporter [Cyathus striatus]|nr:vacuolar DHA amino acid exporter [Cyathus striatus]